MDTSTNDLQEKEMKPDIAEVGIENITIAQTQVGIWYHLTENTRPTGTRVGEYENVTGFKIGLRNGSWEPMNGHQGIQVSDTINSVSLFVRNARRKYIATSIDKVTLTGMDPINTTGRSVQFDLPNGFADASLAIFITVRVFDGTWKTCKWRLDPQMRTNPGGSS